MRLAEGILCRAVHLASIQQQSTVTLDLARTALREYEEENAPSRSTHVSDILKEIQSFYRVRAKELISSSKVRRLVLARHVGMFLARELTRLSLEEIGMHFGGRDHTTVLYGLDRVAKLIRENSEVSADIDVLRNRLLRR